jgi:hypothetical protein
MIPGEQVHMIKGKPWYAPVFKAEAVALAERADGTQTQTAKDLRIALEPLRK